VARKWTLFNRFYGPLRCVHSKVFVRQKCFYPCWIQNWFMYLRTVLFFSFYLIIFFSLILKRRNAVRNTVSPSYSAVIKTFTERHLITYIHKNWLTGIWNWTSYTSTACKLLFDDEKCQLFYVYWKHIEIIFTCR